MGDDFKLDVLKQALKTQRSEAQQREEALQNQLNGLWQVRDTPSSARSGGARVLVRRLTSRAYGACVRGLGSVRTRSASYWLGR
jgi:hypothetical protein